MAEKNFPSKEVSCMKGHQGSVLTAKFNTDGGYCLSGGNDKTIRLWNPFTSKLIKIYHGHGWEVLDLTVSFDNSRIASCGGDRQVFLWDVATGQPVRKWRGHMHRVNCVAYNEDNSVLVSGSYDKTVRIWDCKSNNFDAIQVINDALDSITSIFISGNEIITASVDGRIRNYDVRKGQVSTDTLGHPITSVRLTHDNNCILASCLDDTVRLLDKSSGELLNEYKGHKNSNFKIDNCLSCNDAYICSGSEDGYVYIWDLVDAKVVGKIAAHTAGVSCLAYHPKQDNMLSSSVDGVIKLWKV